MAHLHEVKDSDKHFIIDPITMTISNANNTKNKLQQGDHNSEIFTFQLPKVIEGHDMSLCDVVRVHYINKGANNADVSKDIHKVLDMAVAEDDAETIVFSWLIHGNGTKYNGSLNFRILFGCTDENGDYTYKKWTEIFKGIAIGEGFENDETVLEAQADILEQMFDELEDDIANAGKVKTVNGVEPDENGNIQIETGGNANVTAENIEAALGYTPANQTEVSQLSEEIKEIKESGTGLTDDAKTALLNCFKNVAWTVSNGQDFYNALETALNSSGSSGDDTTGGETEATLSSISATYTGGSVAVGTALTSLIGITVKATYSDGSTKTVTGYTLSGEIVEGENTITVSYGGKTTTFMVTGVAESNESTEREITVSGTFPKTATWDPTAATFTLSESLKPNTTYRFEVEVSEFSSSNAYLHISHYSNSMSSTGFDLDKFSEDTIISKVYTTDKYWTDTKNIAINCNKGSETSNQTAVIQSFKIYELSSN